MVSQLLLKRIVALTPSWYQQLIQFVYEHRDTPRMTDDNGLTAQPFKEMLQTQSQPRCVEIWQRFFHPKPRIPWAKIWNGKSSNRVQEFLWELTHRVLPTKEYLSKWGMAVNPGCPFCRHQEDIHHVIIHCFRAQTLWADLQPILARVVGANLPINLATIIFCLNLPQDQTTGELCHYIIATAAEILWHTRNKKAFDDNYKPGISELR